MKRLYGLIGFPIGHSFSAAYFTDKFAKEKVDAEYRLFPLPGLENFPKLLQQYSSLQGLNVTLPHKQQILRFLDNIDDAAMQVGAVNCIAIHKGNLTGFNTDIIGFKNSLEPLLKTHHTRALVLGTGGSAMAVQYVLKGLNIAFANVSRTPGKDALLYADITPETIQQYPLIINTTPVGMFPQTEALPSLPYASLTAQHLLFDLVYNPVETAFLRQGKSYGATTKNGFEMLQLQAEASWEIWNAYL
ncbi:MAG: shikimate dehydrogenase [Bacteroidetes bacterium]|nr:shikimate dehydrogenase [Bacteroidota bacterium]MBS1741003.1 shikimate dehydrogenase [Bacteroidota bacterium]